MLQTSQNDTTSSPSLCARSPYVTGKFTCNACDASGVSFHYHSIDNFDLHIGCAALPQSVIHKKYNIILNLRYSFPLHRQPSATKCSVCTKAFPSNRWVYYNANTNSISHLNCVLTGNESTAIDIQRRLCMMIPVSSSSSSRSFLSRALRC